MVRKFISASIFLILCSSTAAAGSYSEDYSRKDIDVINYLNTQINGDDFVLLEDGLKHF